MLYHEVWTCAQDRVPPLLRDKIVSLDVLIEYNDFGTEEEVIEASVNSSCSRPIDCLDKILLTFQLFREKYSIVEVRSKDSETKSAMEDTKHEAQK